MDNYKELLGEELYNKVTEALKDKDVNLIIDNKKESKWIPKTRFDELVEQKNQLKTQTGELTGQLDTLKKSAKGNDELTKQIEELQNSNNDWKVKHDKSLMKSAVKIAALENNAKNADVIEKLIDYDKLKIGDDNSIQGIEEQFKALKESNDFLFNQEAQSETKTQKGNNNPNNPPASGNHTKKTEKEKYEELYKKVSENPSDHALREQLFLQKARLK